MYGGRGARTGAPPAHPCIVPCISGGHEFPRPPWAGANLRDKGGHQSNPSRGASGRSQSAATAAVTGPPPDLPHPIRSGLHGSRAAHTSRRRAIESSHARKPARATGNGAWSHEQYPRMTHAVYQSPRGGALVDSGTSHHRPSPPARWPGAGAAWPTISVRNPCLSTQNTVHSTLSAGP